MTKDKIYEKPQLEVLALAIEGSVLAGSTLVDGNASGEGITWGDEFDPWK